MTEVLIVTFGHRYKFDEIKELLSDKIVDIFFVAESKLDATFNDNLFKCS
jgi:hypothetical protein